MQQSRRESGMQGSEAPEPRVGGSSKPGNASNWLDRWVNIVFVHRLQPPSLHPGSVPLTLRQFPTCLPWIQGHRYSARDTGGLSRRLLRPGGEDKLRTRVQAKNGLWLMTDVDREASQDMLTAAMTTLDVCDWEFELAVVTENGGCAWTSGGTTKQ